MMTMTYHCEVERRTRVQKIINSVGLGQIIIERYYRSPEKIRTGQAGTYTCITDTGVTIIKTEDRQKIITMYVTTQRELVAVYGGTKKIPPFLKKRVSRNETFYIKEGKTRF